RARTRTGDRSELQEFDEEDPLWSHVNSSAETRIGAGCAHYEECFVTRVRSAAEGAKLLIVNHHLLISDLASRGPHGGGFLPEYEAVIFDEAHHLEDVVAQVFGGQ